MTSLGINMIRDGAVTKATVKEPHNSIVFQRQILLTLQSEITIVPGTVKEELAGQKGQWLINITKDDNSRFIATIPCLGYWQDKAVPLFGFWLSIPGLPDRYIQAAFMPNHAVIIGRNVLLQNGGMCIDGRMNCYHYGVCWFRRSFPKLT